MAHKKQCTVGQLALAWLLAQGEDIVPIPGTKHSERLIENIGALSVTLTERRTRADFGRHSGRRRRRPALSRAADEERLSLSADVRQRQSGQEPQSMKLARISIAKCLAAAFILFLVLSVDARAEAVRIMAAFTFKSALDEVVAVYKSDSGGEVVPLYGMTPALAKQVENLAPADIFLSADLNWMNYLQDRGLIRADTRVDLLTADLVLVTRSDNTAAPAAVPIGRDYPLQKILGDGRLAMCNPAGESGRQARPRRIGRARPVASGCRQDRHRREPSGRCRPRRAWRGTRRLGLCHRCNGRRGGQGRWDFPEGFASADRVSGRHPARQSQSGCGTILRVSGIVESRRGLCAFRLPFAGGEPLRERRVSRRSRTSRPPTLKRRNRVKDARRGVTFSRRSPCGCLRPRNCGISDSGKCHACCQ